MVAAGGANGHIIGPLSRFTTRLAGGLPQDVPELLALYEFVPEGVADIVVRALVAEGRVDEARAYWLPDQEPHLDYYWLLWQGCARRTRSRSATGGWPSGATGSCCPGTASRPGCTPGRSPWGRSRLILGDLAAFLGRDGSAHYERAVRVAERIGSPALGARGHGARTAG